MGRRLRARAVRTERPPRPLPCRCYAVPLCSTLRNELGLRLGLLGVSQFSSDCSPLGRVRIGDRSDRSADHFLFQTY